MTWSKLGLRPWERPLVYDLPLSVTLVCYICDIFDKLAWTQSISMPLYVTFWCDDSLNLLVAGYTIPSHTMIQIWQYRTQYWHASEVSNHQTANFSVQWFEIPDLYPYPSPPYQLIFLRYSTGEKLTRPLIKSHRYTRLNAMVNCDRSPVWFISSTLPCHRHSIWELQWHKDRDAFFRPHLSKFRDKVCEYYIVTTLLIRTHIWVI